MAKTSENASSTPLSHLFTEPPPIQDILATETSSAQHRTVQECLPYLRNVNEPSGSRCKLHQHPLPQLHRHPHIDFLHDALEPYPESLVGLDAARPWMLYWALMGLYLLGQDVSQYREQVIKTLAPMQNPTGGFGGGHGQYSHLASTYAAVLSLALVGGEAAFSLIDRKAMWQWLGRLKQPDGGFQVCQSGEQDVRGAYCAMVLITLLDLGHCLPPEFCAPDDHGTFDQGLEDYLSRCQTYEGGISGDPGNEAHGAYAFCALACLCLLNEPRHAFRRLDLPLLISWLSSRQYAPEGGFAGRTNKLVDGCYSHWVGGCWPLIQSAVSEPPSVEQDPNSIESATLYNAEALARYILSCCQSEKGGGLRDKPSKPSDSYHTCYTLAGLSAVQHHHYHVSDDGRDPGLPHQFRWRCWPILDPPDHSASDISTCHETLQSFHPLYVIPHAAAERVKNWSQSQGRDWST